MDTEWASGVGFELELPGQTHDYKHRHTCVRVLLCSE